MINESVYKNYEKSNNFLNIIVVKLNYFNDFEICQLI